MAAAGRSADSAARIRASCPAATTTYRAGRVDDRAGIRRPSPLLSALVADLAAGFALAADLT
jgi:hypothetical protein